MDRDSIDGLIEHEIAELRTSFPQITGCRAFVERLNVGEARRYSLRLDVRLPQHQTLISGKSKDDAHAAVYAAFAEARQRLEELKARAAAREQSLPELKDEELDSATLMALDTDRLKNRALCRRA